MNSGLFVSFESLFAIALLLGCAQQAPQKQPETAAGTGAASPSTPAPPAQLSGNAKGTGISPAELAAHNKENDCWVAYDSKVYDITGYLPNHRDYLALIVPLCGTSSEFQDAFTGQHGTSKVQVLQDMGIYKGELIQ
ncbi:Cytochrome b5-like Heme/Steroid binding domain protein [uncultured archaeon]|nr:Cytochrome b5-like Heme/Steroid binding domain protein [uncultured archaeon]